MKVFCILSDERVYCSRSPAMFSRVLQRIGIQAAYVPFRVEPHKIGQALEALKVLNIAGANITAPYKETVIPYLDQLSEGAGIIGAINTIVRNGDKLKGYNTNAIGFMDALNDAGFETGGRSALVFGTGGAAKAVIFMLNWLQAAAVHVAGRNFEKTRHIVERFGGTAHRLAEIADHPVDVDLIVNATSVSSFREAPALAEIVAGMAIPGCRLIFDLNYGRSQNFWQTLARRRNIRFTDGLGALAYQARRSLTLWTGVQVASQEFLNALPG